jgi:hypothetical protein
MPSPIKEPTEAHLSIVGQRWLLEAGPASPASLLDRFFFSDAGGGPTRSIRSSWPACAGMTSVGSASCSRCPPGRNRAGPCHSPCLPALRPTPQLIRGMSHPLLLATQVVPRRPVPFALRTSTLSANLSPPLQQELRPRSEQERSPRARRPLSAENNLLRWGSDRPPREAGTSRRLPRPQQPPPSLLPRQRRCRSMIFDPTSTLRALGEPPLPCKAGPAHPTCTLSVSPLISLPVCKNSSHSPSPFPCLSRRHRGGIGATCPPPANISRLGRILSHGDPKRAPGAEFCALLHDALACVHACRACCSCLVQKSGPMCAPASPREPLWVHVVVAHL